MKSIKKYATILLGIFLFVSCEKDIVFKGDITDPLVVVNSYITPDSIISAHVSESRFFLNDTTSFKEISNAEVSVLVNGTFKENMTYSENGIYLGTYKPVIGETIKLVVKVPSKKDVSCEAIINPKPDILSLDTTDIWTGESYQINYGSYSIDGGPAVITNDTVAIVKGHQINYTLKFKDNGSEKNYYRLVVITKETYVTINKMTNDTITEIRDNYYYNFTDVVSGNNTNNDPLSIVGNSTNNLYNVFSDELFNGKTYSLSFVTNEDVYTYKPGYLYGPETPVKQTVNIFLQSISKDYYLYLKSRPVATAGTDFFSEAVQIHTNIAGGIGILGSYTSGNVIKIELK